MEAYAQETYLHKILSSEELSREKLELYLQTPDKVELYKEALDKFTANGEISRPLFKPTWSWWAFFSTWAFFLYRKDLLLAFITFILIITPGLNLFAMIFSGISGKYFVIKRFINILSLNNAALLQDRGGVYKWVIWLCAILGIILTITTFVLIYLAAERNY